MKWYSLEDEYGKRLILLPYCPKVGEIIRHDDSGADYKVISIDKAKRVGKARLTSDPRD